MAPRAFIVGLAGPELASDEADFLRRVEPWGVILFARNVVDPDQVRRLTHAIRGASARAGIPIFVDEEGGRVQRLRPPHWPDYPPARSIGQAYDRDPDLGLRAAWAHARLIADDVHGLGLTTSCLPVLDIAIEGAHSVIGARAYHRDPAVVAKLGAAAADGLIDGGCLPVIKHMPGHGRTRVDSHHDLPVVDAGLDELAETDFAPFRALNTHLMGMTGHLVFTACDPDSPATQSARIISDVIRRQIGFDGLLMTDDISMNALRGSVTERAERAIAAGCDLVLHCNGKMDEMLGLERAMPELSVQSLARADAALAAQREPEPFDRAAALDLIDEVRAASEAA